jgi:hypothetical protein
MIGKVEILEDFNFYVTTKDGRYLIPKHIGKLIHLKHLNCDIEFELNAGKAFPSSDYLYFVGKKYDV